MAGLDRDGPLLSRRAALALGAGAVATAGGAVAGLLRNPDAAEVAGRGAAVEPQRGSFDFRPAGRKSIPAHYAIGAVEPASAGVVIVMHGEDRNAADYRDAWVDLVRGRPLIAVAPQFGSSDFPGSREYNQGGILDRDGDLRDAEAWAFGYIEPLFRQMRDRVGGGQTSFDLFGHSAGAQFVHRYVELMPAGSLRRAIAANAGWYTMPDAGVPYPYGAGGAARGLFDWPGAFRTELTVMVGDQDVLDANLRHDEGADAQGMTRWARGHAFLEQARDRAATLGVPIAWSLREVAGVGHDYRQMSAHAAALLG